MYFLRFCSNKQHIHCMGFESLQLLKAAEPEGDSSESGEFEDVLMCAQRIGRQQLPATPQATLSLHDRGPRVINQTAEDLVALSGSQTLEKVSCLSVLGSYLPNVPSPILPIHVYRCYSTCGPI